MVNFLPSPTAFTIHHASKNIYRVFYWYHIVLVVCWTKSISISRTWKSAKTNQLLIPRSQRTVDEWAWIVSIAWRKSRMGLFYLGLYGSFVFWYNDGLETNSVITFIRASTIENSWFALTPASVNMDKGICLMASENSSGWCNSDK